MRLNPKFLLLLNILIFGGCTQMCSPSRKDLTPEEVVEAYLDISLNMTSNSDRQRLVSLTSGNLRQALVEASDETIQLAFIERHYRIESYTVVERLDRTPREVEIAFELGYRDLGDTAETKVNDAPSVLTENRVSLIKKEGAWFIQDVIGKKTEIDFPVTETVVKPGEGEPYDPSEDPELSEDTAEEQPESEGEMAPSPADTQEGGGAPATGETAP